MLDLDLGPAIQPLWPAWQLPTGLAGQLRQVGGLGDLEGPPVPPVLVVLVVAVGVVEVAVLVLLLDLRLHLPVGLVQPSQIPNAMMG